MYVCMKASLVEVARPYGSLPEYCRNECDHECGFNPKKARHCNYCVH